MHLGLPSYKVSVRCAVWANELVPKKHYLADLGKRSR
jgi:hypothetical protein